MPRFGTGSAISDSNGGKNRDVRFSYDTLQTWLSSRSTAASGKSEAIRSSWKMIKASFSWTSAIPIASIETYYEEYLKPRAGAGLLDLLVMGLLPHLEGIYRTDLETGNLWQQFRRAEHYRKLEDIDGILLTHAHLDHSGHISFLREDIPVYSTATTAFIAKAIQDSGKADFDQQVCYFTPRVEECLKEWKQGAYFASGSGDRQRRFCIA